MLKLLFFLSIFLYSSVLGAEGKVEIYASTMESLDGKVESSGGITLIYNKYILTADRSVYNRNSGEMELYGNIRLNHGGSFKVLGEYAKLNLAKKEKLFKPFYMSEKESEVWMSASEANMMDSDIAISSGAVSGCNPVDPLWKFEFSSSDYNSHTKWTNIYNARFYIEDIPIFYTPYFGYSLDKTRRSGLLMPSIGYSSNEGMYYEQPIYIAPQNWWDLELRPQVRSERGYGVYETFRFVDSKISRGDIKAGYFKEQNSYFIDNKLQNRTHYGFEINYDNGDFINQWFGTSLSGQSGLYIDINHMNDVDYINLSTNNIQNSTTATQVLSRINMFYNTTEHYVGTYFKYYQDLALADNTQTLQKLPTLQYHYYLKTLFDDHFLYNLDVKSNNITRSVGKTVIQTDINLPVSLQASLFDEYLNVSYKANIFMQHSKFMGDEVPQTIPTEFNNGYLLRNYHTLSASTQLTRGYDELSHVISFGISYNKSASESKTGFYDDNAVFCADPANSASSRCEFYNISSVQDEAQLELIQYFYDKSAKQILYHRLAQKIFYSDVQDQYGELENELDYQITSYLNYYNNMFYNYNERNFSKIFNKLSIHNKGINLGLSHLYKDTFIEAVSTLPRYTSYLTSTLGYTYNTHYSFNALYNYDIEAHEKKSMEIGFMYRQRCWNFGLRYSENRRPILTTEGDSFVDDKYIYLSVVLKPIMQVRDGSSLMTFQLPKND